MQPLYLARIEDLRHGDLVKVDCAACHHVALLTPEFLLRLGLYPEAKVLDLKDRVRVPRLRSEGTSRCFDQVAATQRVSRCAPRRGLLALLPRHSKVGAIRLQPRLFAKQRSV